MLIAMVLRRVPPERSSARQAPRGSTAFDLIELVTVGPLGFEVEQRSLPFGSNHEIVRF